MKAGVIGGIEANGNDFKAMALNSTTGQGVPKDQASSADIAFGDTQNAFQNIEVTNQLQRNAENTLALTQSLYEIGKSSIVDLNQAQLAATQAEIVHTDSIYGYRAQRALLDYLTGVAEGS